VASKKRKPRYDWEYYRHQYVTGDATLAELATLQAAPKLDTLKHHSMQEDWPGQREQYRHQTATKTQDLASTTEAEVAARHVRIAKVLQEKALQRLKGLDMSSLTPREVLAFIREATDIERKALGMDNLTIRNLKKVNWQDLTEEQLRRIAAGEDPDSVLDSG